MQKRVLVCGAGGFIGGHLVTRLKQEGFWVRGADLKRHEYVNTAADEFMIGDLRDQAFARRAVEGNEDVYQLAADMGRAGYAQLGDYQRECT